jgi:hypothetical protein
MGTVSQGGMARDIIDLFAIEPDFTTPLPQAFEIFLPCTSCHIVPLLA